MSDLTREFEEELIRRTEQGDAEAGKELLRSIVHHIDNNNLNSPLFSYLAKCLWQFTQDGVPLERALGVEIEPNKGGRPAIYDPYELAAVDILLRDYAGFKPEQAVTWIEDNIGADRRATQRIRNEFDSRYNKHADTQLTEALDRGILLHMSGSMRKKVAEVLPQK